jgi:hypothetical protein
MEIPVEPWTSEQALEFVEKFYGSYSAYRRLNYQDTERQILEFELKRKLALYDGDVEKLCKKEPQFYERCRRGFSIIVGNRIKTPPANASAELEDGTFLVD